jgi:hypothetical protein
LFPQSFENLRLLQHNEREDIMKRFHSGGTGKFSIIFWLPFIFLVCGIMLPSPAVSAYYYGYVDGNLQGGTSNYFYKAYAGEGIPFQYIANSGTPTPTFNSSSLQLSNSVSLNSPGDASYGSLTTSVNFQEGTLKFFATAQDDGTSSVRASGSAWLQDTLTLDWGSRTDPFELGVKLTVSGSNTATVLGSAYASLSVAVGTDSKTQQLSLDSSFTSPQEIIFTFFIDPNSSSHTMSLDTLLSIGYITDGTADFSHTASLSLDMPEGVTFSSGSGVLLQPVPLPGAVWLLGSGLLGLAGWRRFRKN